MSHDFLCSRCHRPLLCARALFLCFVGVRADMSTNTADCWRRQSERDTKGEKKREKKRRGESPAAVCSRNKKKGRPTAHQKSGTAPKKKAGVRKKIERARRKKPARPRIDALTQDTMNTKGWYSRRTVVAIRATSDAISVPRDARGPSPDRDDPLGAVAGHEGPPASGNTSPLDARRTALARKRPLSQSATMPSPTPKRTCDRSPPADVQQQKKQSLDEILAPNNNESVTDTTSPRAHSPSLVSAKHGGDDAAQDDGECDASRSADDTDNNDDHERTPQTDSGDDGSVDANNTYTDSTSGNQDDDDDGKAYCTIDRQDWRMCQRRSWSDDKDDASGSGEQEALGPDRRGTSVGPCHDARNTVDMRLLGGNTDSRIGARQGGDNDSSGTSRDTVDDDSNLDAQSDSDFDAQSDDSHNDVQSTEHEPTAADWQRSPAAAVAVGLRAEARRLERLCRVNEAVWRQTESALQGVRFAIKRLDRMAARGH
ncbi:TOP2c incomplete domain containing protein [Pandoravirus salinus]|uniref:TOP2c incomplete domain containing protein n=1 Tax=Pandoravirus salinus TaxID=1349410 RepID=S4VZK1_9VIRU|nr:TOP2c superfamily incomplete domain [Pandoravirus salinus]AGO84941.1 TOP2c incomplete domain containing protein [Pandoravirus salinus]